MAFTAKQLICIENLMITNANKFKVGVQEGGNANLLDEFEQVQDFENLTDGIIK